MTSLLEQMCFTLLLLTKKESKEYFQKEEKLRLDGERRAQWDRGKEEW